MIRKAIDIFGGSVQTVAATGSDQAGAAAIACSMAVVTGADDAKGVVLPAAAKTKAVFVCNTVSNKILKVYPPTGGKINGGSANAAASQAAGFNCWYLSDGTDWYSTRLVDAIE